MVMKRNTKQSEYIVKVNEYLEVCCNNQIRMVEYC